MNHNKIRPLAMLALLALAGCAIEEVEDAQQRGTLYFRAQNSYADSVSVPGQLSIAGRGSVVFAEGQDFLAIPDLPLDSNLVLSFIPDLSDEWFPRNAVFRFAAGLNNDTLRLPVFPRDSTLTLQVRTISEDGELPGMPLWLDGLRWDEDSPTTLYFSPGQPHELRVGEDACLRADTSFTFDEQPVTGMDLAVSSVSITADPGAGALLVVNEQLPTPGVWQARNPAIRDYFISAYRPGHVATPAYDRLTGLCGGSTVFSWTSADTGYAAGQIFPDFTLTRVLPGQTEPVGDFSLRQLRGRVILVNFWFINCPACQEEMPHFQDLLEEYGPRGFRILALNPYPTDSPVLYPNYDFTFLRDNQSPPVTQLAAVTAFPSNFIIGPDGRIHGRYGGMSRDALTQILEDLLP